MSGRSLEDIQDEILDALHGGEPLDRAVYLARYPEHADALRRFFDLVAVIETPATPAPVQPSRLGEFEIIREVGRGGMGVVYEARQASLNRKVALKVLPPAMRSDRRLLARFQREAEAAARLRHPNIVPVYSIGESAGAPFFAMELVEGRSLAEIIKLRKAGDDAGLPKAGPDYRRWAVTTVARIADALDYAHGRGILHRDVKPGNILIEADGTPRLTDFGLALDLQASELTQTGEMFGSPLYMSPEQAFRSEQPVDARTDIYSLAVTLYELLMLRLPYHGTSHAELMSALSSGKIVAPRLADPDCPEPLERVLVQALRSEPHERYATAGAFAVDLRAALERPQDVRAVAETAATERKARARADGHDHDDGQEPVRGLIAEISLGKWGPAVGAGLLFLAFVVHESNGSSLFVIALVILGFMVLRRSGIWKGMKPSRPESAPPVGATPAGVPPAGTPPEQRSRWKEWRRERPIFSGWAFGCGCLVFAFLGFALITALFGSRDHQRARDLGAQVTSRVWHTIETQPGAHGVDTVITKEHGSLEAFRALAVQCDLSFDSVMPEHVLAAPSSQGLADYPSPSWRPLLGRMSGEAPDDLELERVDGVQPESIDDAGVEIAGPLSGHFASHGGQLLLCPDGIAATGSMTADGYCTLLVAHDLAGRCVFDSYATTIIDGALTGSIEAHSYANALITGDLSGRFVGKGHTLLYILGRMTGSIELDNDGKLYIGGRMARADLERITGKAAVLLRDSDLEAGVHQIGQLTVTVQP